MVNRLAGTSTKMLTLVPILAAIYYFDLSRFLVIFTSANLLPFFLIAASLFALGVVMKWRILRTELELSHVSFPWGLVLLALAVFLYVYGSYTSNTVWFRYESMYVLVLSYVAFRIGPRILRTLAPLLLILAFSFSPLTVLSFLSPGQFVLISYGLFLLLFLAYVRLRIKAVLLPFVVVFLGLLAWAHPTVLLAGRGLFLEYLIPIPLVALIVPAARRFMQPSQDSSFVCSEHQTLSDGFCSNCGRKIAPATGNENVGLGGILAIIAVAFLLIFTTVPVLAMRGGAPYDAYYSTHGFSGTTIPPTPTGWQINSTTVYNFTSQGDVYAVGKVYVPTFHPETKNYTMYFEVATVSPYSTGPAGGEIAGWDRQFNVFTQVGPFQGHLTTYTTATTTMLAYQGTSHLLFLNGNTFGQYYIGLGFVRQFKNTDINADKSQFLMDINALWVPGFTNNVSYSSWTAFLSIMYGDTLALETSVALVSSIAIIGWIAYRASKLDDELDRFLTVASMQTDENWSYLSGLLDRPRQTGTGQELASTNGLSTNADMERLDSSLRKLEERHLIRRFLSERGADLVSVWRAVV